MFIPTHKGSTGSIRFSMDFYFSLAMMGSSMIIHLTNVFNVIQIAEHVRIQMINAHPAMRIKCLMNLNAMICVIDIPIK